MAVGAPVIVMVLADQEAVTPVGKPVAEPIPVAPVVLCVIVVKIVLIHTVCGPEEGVTVLFGFTVIVPVANTVLQPPVKGIL